MSEFKPNFGLPVKHEGFLNPDCRDVFTFFDDFLGSSISGTDDAAKWDLSGTGGTAVLADATDAEQEMAGGLVAMATAATSTDTSNMVVNGESFNIDQGYELYFETRFMPVDISERDFYIGLTTSTRTIAADLVKGIVFHQDDSVLKIVSDNGAGTNTDTISGVTLADGAWYIVAMHYDGANEIHFYLKTNDGDFDHIHTLFLDVTADYVPEDTMMTPTMEAYAVKAGATSDIVYVDYVLCQQRRCLAAE